MNPGRHEIVASLAGDEKRESVEVAAGETKTVALPLEGAPPPGEADRAAIPDKPERSEGAETSTSPLVWVGAGVAGVGLAVGAITGLTAIGIHGDVASRCEGGVRCPESTHADIDRGEMLGTVSTIAFVVAGLGAGVLVYGLLNPRVERGDATSAALRPSVFASPFGVAGTF